MGLTCQHRWGWSGQTRVGGFVTVPDSIQVVFLSPLSSWVCSRPWDDQARESLCALEFVGEGMKTALWEFFDQRGAGILFSGEVRAFRGFLRDVRETGRSPMAVQPGDRRGSGRAQWVWASLEGPVG